MRDISACAECEEVTISILRMFGNNAECCLVQYDSCAYHYLKCLSGLALIAAKVRSSRSSRKQRGGGAGAGGGSTKKNACFFALPENIPPAAASIAMRSPWVFGVGSAAMVTTTMVACYVLQPHHIWLQRVLSTIIRPHARQTTLMILALSLLLLCKFATCTTILALLLLL